MKYSEHDYNTKQLALEYIGEKGQELLSGSKVLVIGAGGLGSSVLPYLVGVGLHTITIVESDTLDITNIHRQVLYNVDELGLPKCALATQKLKKRNPFVNITSVPERLTKDNIDKLFTSHDLVIDCTDNQKTRFLIHDTAIKYRIDLITGAVYKIEGTLNLFRFSKSSSPCLRCLWNDVPDKTLEARPVIGPVVGIIGSMMATEAIKVLLGKECIAQGETVIFDAKEMSIDKIKWSKSPECSYC
ncbi:MAG: HesA/MoeB/ThiF family protein [Bacteriovoracaceae bacterium]|nr:HesA/MoeB/ThiF family protein [Bacteriovoracaceae bacterium]